MSGILARRAVFRCREGEGSVSSTGGGGNFAPRGKSVHGQWAWDGVKLSVGPYLSCTHLTYNDKPTLSCEVKTAVQTSAAVGAL